MMKTIELSEASVASQVSRSLSPVTKHQATTKSSTNFGWCDSGSDCGCGVSSGFGSDLDCWCGFGKLLAGLGCAFERAAAAAKVRTLRGLRGRCIESVQRRSSFVLALLRLGCSFGFDFDFD